MTFSTPSTADLTPLPWPLCWTACPPGRGAQVRWLGMAPGLKFLAVVS